MVYLKRLLEFEYICINIFPMVDIQVLFYPLVLSRFYLHVSLCSKMDIQQKKSMTQIISVKIYIFYYFFQLKTIFTF